MTETNGISKKDAPNGTLLPDDEESEIQKFFNGKTIFITGATGFLGKLILEKLLRSCKEIKQVYILIREKKNKEPKDRLEEMLNVPAFDILKKEQPNFMGKISTFIGDCNLPCLGLSEEDKMILLNEVNCVFHAAATVRFDAELRKAAYINVRCVRDLVDMAKEMKQLKSFVHVSTAYSNCIRQDIGETYYKPLLTGEKLLDVVEALDDEMLAKITPHLLQDYPNTYAFTKAIAEEIIETNGKTLPIAILRPSIVIGCLKEPLPGWIDNFYGPTGVLFGAGLGLLRTLHCRPDYTADIVPADLVVNSIIAVGWNVGQKRLLIEMESNNTNNKTAMESPTIYNFVSGNQNPITWETYTTIATKRAKEVPSPLIIWHAIFRVHTSAFVHKLAIIFLHNIPAHIVDLLARIIGKEPKLVDGYKKINKFCDVISYFATREWRFKDNNTRELFSKLNGRDKKLFDFDIKAIDWDTYLKIYVRGGRIYLLKDPLDTVPAGRKKIFKLFIFHYALLAVLCLILFYLVKLILSFIF